MGVVVILWRKFMRLLGEEHWEIPLRIDREDFRESLQTHMALVPRRVALSPGWGAGNGQFYGHIGTEELVLRFHPSKSDPRPLVSLVDLYAFVGRVVKERDGFTLVGDYRVVPIFRLFGMFFFGTLLLSILTDSVTTVTISLAERNPTVASRGFFFLLAKLLFVAFLRFLVWLPERWDRPFRRKLRQYLSDLAAGGEA